MRITGIKAYRVELPLRRGQLQLVGRQVACSVFDSTVVAVETDDGPVGHGEVCPLGPVLPAGLRRGRAGGARASSGPHLIGQDPRELGRAQPPHGRGAEGPPLRQVGDRRGLLGHPRPGAGLPVCTLLGGRFGEDFALYRAISQESPGRRWRPRSRATGPRATAGSSSRSAASRTTTSPASAPSRPSWSPATCLVADANTGWTMHEAGPGRATRSATSTSTSSSPASTYEECLSIRRRTAMPFVLDELIDGLPMVVRGLADGRWTSSTSRSASSAA